VNREPDPDGGSELGDGADQFDAIVAGWRNEGGVPRWPETPSDGAALEITARDVADRDITDREVATPDATSPVPVVRPFEPVDNDEHFVPPEPPPLPRIGPPAAVGLALIVLGIVLIASPGWVGVPELYGVPLGLVSIASGLGWLVLRLWPDHSADDRDDDDDGAIL
jgi:hypothetical protein